MGEISRGMTGGNGRGEMSRGKCPAPQKIVSDSRVHHGIPGIKGQSVKKGKFNTHSHNVQDKELKLHRYANDSPVHVVERLTILWCPSGFRNKGLITRKHALAEFSRCRAETVQVELLDCKGRRVVNN